MAGGYIPAQTRAMSIGRVMNLTVRAITTNPVTLIGTAFVISGLPQGLLSLVQLADPRQVQAWADQFATGALSPGLIFAALGIFLLIFIPLAIAGQAVMIRATLSASNDEVATIGDCLSTAGRNLFPLLGLGILSGLAIGLGLLLLIVPGIILMIMWYVAAPSLVVEQLGVTGSMERSADLTRGARWNVLLLVIIAGAIGFGVSMVFGMINLAIGGATGAMSPGGLASGGVPTAFVISSAICNTLSSTVTGLVSGVMPTALYVELHEWKEGPGTEALDTIFA